MRLSRLVTVGIASVAVVVCTMAASAHGSSTSDIDDSSTKPLDVAALNAFVARQVRRDHLPGVALGVVDGGRVVDLSGFGKADDKHAVTPRTPFLLASMSKPLTATAVLQLVSAGKVRLDHPVHDYLPEFEMADRSARRITVRQLLQHTSGIPVTSCDTRRDATTLKQYVAELRTVHLASLPGARHSYCSGNYNVLGRLVEVISGETFGTYMQRQVFGPLDMSRSFTSERAADAAGMARGHRWLFGALDARDERYNTSQLPSGFLISSAEDMTHFLAAQLNGGSFRGRSVLAPDWVAAMQAPGVPVPGAPGDTYGLGWRRSDVGGVPTVQHYGDNYYFHGVLFLDPRTRRAVVVLINGNGVLPVTTAFKTLEAGVAQIVDGQSPKPAQGLTLRQRFLVQDLLLAALLVLVLWPLLRLPHWTRRLRRDRAAARSRRFRTAARISAEIVLPLSSSSVSE